MTLAQSDPFTTADAITIGIASLGALTGIVSLTITVSQIWLSGSRLRVEITAAQFGPTTGTFVHGADWPDANKDKYPIRQVAVHAINRGRMPTSIDTWGIDLGAGIYFRLPHSPSNPVQPRPIAADDHPPQRLGDARDLGCNHRAPSSVAPDQPLTESSVSCTPNRLISELRTNQGFRLLTLPVQSVISEFACGEPVGSRVIYRQTDILESTDDPFPCL